jgi:hypothetical protein
MEGDAAYFTRRANEERESAMKAAHPNARRAHLTMAGRYSDLAHSMIAEEQSWGLHHGYHVEGTLSA